MDIVHLRPIHCNRMWWNTFYISKIGVRVFLKWSKATTTSYSHDLYLAGCWDLGPPHLTQKQCILCQHYGFTTMKLFYWLIILNSIILLIIDGQSTIIEAPEVISPSPLTSPLQNQRQNEPETKMSTLTPLMGMLWSIIFNQTCRIFGPIRVGLITQKQFWDHLKKLTFLGPDPLVKSSSSISNIGPITIITK